MHREQTRFFSVSVDDIQNGRKDFNLKLFWDFKKQVDLAETTSVLDQMGCTLCECKLNRTIVEEINNLCESLVSQIRSKIFLTKRNMLQKSWYAP